MSVEKLECVGQMVSFEACFGQDAEVTRQLGNTACMTCVVSAFRKLSEENESLRGQAERDGLTGACSTQL